MCHVGLSIHRQQPAPVFIHLKKAAVAYRCSCRSETVEATFNILAAVGCLDYFPSNILELELHEGCSQTQRSELWEGGNVSLQSNILLSL